MIQANSKCKPFFRKGEICCNLVNCLLVLQIFRFSESSLKWGVTQQLKHTISCLFWHYNVYINFHCTLFKKNYAGIFSIVFVLTLISLVVKILTSMSKVSQILWLRWITRKNYSFEGSNSRPSCNFSLSC